jgi:hypothetical protein
MVRKKCYFGIVLHLAIASPLIVSFRGIVVCRFSLRCISAYGADTEVIKSLAEAFPESKTTIDRKGRTPLHFALGTANSNSAAVVVLLSSTGAASYVDDNGMLVSSC